MENKLMWGEVCELIKEYNKFLETSPHYNHNADDKIYEATKHFPLFLQQNGYDIWKRN
jgi:hypothetical protein